MARVARIRRYPVKGLDGESVEAATVTPAGSLAGDRAFALCDPDVDPDAIDDRGSVAEFAYNGKQSARLHELDTSVDPETGTLAVRPPDGEPRRFDLGGAAGRDRAADWFGDYVGDPVAVRRAGPTGFVDRPDLGPSVISTATVEAVAGWFDGLGVDGARRRLRANVEIGGVPAFWEDRFVGPDAPAFRAGDVRFEGGEPCARCVVPARDPDTGEPLADFRERFVRRREETFPDWADRDAFDHFYTLMLISRIPEADRGGEIRVGDAVETVPAPTE